MPRLVVHRTSFQFGSGRRARHVLDSVDFSPEPGLVTAIVGPNGAGKSTLLRLMLGVLRPTAGSVMIDDHPVAQLPERDRARVIAYIPQRSSVAFAFRVRQVVAMGRYASGGGEAEAVERALGLVGLTDRADDLIGELSAGQQQRATLARALAQLEARPGSTILADEPFSAMDPAHALEGAGILRGLARTGMSVVMVVHDLNLALRFADRALVLGEAGERGSRVVADGPVDDALSADVLSRVFHVRFERAITPGGTALVAI